ncbi:MAG: hypothetical protein ABSF12_25780 [Bryobacteraceae bacterium]
MNERYDLATSFEVAEHLVPWIANSFVDLLCKLSPIIVMSAATPGQTGTDHVNEQPHSYWIDKFEHRHYSFDETSSKQLSRHWQLSNVAGFYYENVLDFRRY